MSTTALVTTAVSLAGGLLAYGFGTYGLAKTKMYFTAPKEGTAEFVMKGNASDRVIVVWEGRRARGIPLLRPENPADPTSPVKAVPYSEYDIIDEATTPNDEKASLPGFAYYLNPLHWMEPFGIYWASPNPFYHIYRYDFVWTEEEQDAQGNIIPRARRATKEAGTEGQTPYIRLNDANYFFFVNNVKTKGNVPLKFTLLVTLRIKNPYKALFLGEDWLLRTGGAISDMTIRYAGALEYEEVNASAPAKLTFMVGGKSRKRSYTLEQLILMLGDGEIDDFTGHDLLTDYGVEIVALKRSSFTFADATAEQAFSDAAAKRYVGKQEGLADQDKAVGEAAAVRTRADAEEYRLNKTYGPVAGNDVEKRMKIRQLEALERAGAQGGATVVIPDTGVGLNLFTNKP
jgi:hypothetical protein